MFVFFKKEKVMLHRASTHYSCEKNTGAPLQFFAEYFNVSAACNREEWVHQIMNELYTWWFVPVNEPHVQNCATRSRAAANLYLESETLPDFIFQAEQYAKRNRA